MTRGESASQPMEQNLGVYIGIVFLRSMLEGACSNTAAKDCKVEYHGLYNYIGQKGQSSAC